MPVATDRTEFEEKCALKKWRENAFLCVTSLRHATCWTVKIDGTTSRRRRPVV